MRISFRRCVRCVSVCVVLSCAAQAEDAPLWKKHIIHAGHRTQTAVAADFTKDGRMDVISNSGGTTRLFAGPDFQPIVLDKNPQHACIHSEVMDVDGDGDVDYIGAR